LPCSDHTPQTWAQLKADKPVEVFLFEESDMQRLLGLVIQVRNEVRESEVYLEEFDIKNFLGLGIHSKAEVREKEFFIDWDLSCRYHGNPFKAKV
jgi:hypothetical protein